MKLVIAVVQGSDVERLLGALVSRGFRATQINSSGGFLREQNVTLLVGVEDEQVATVREVVRQNCHARTRFVNPLMPIVEPGEYYAPSPVEVLVGGATLFVLNVSRHERLGAHAAIT
ncbi:MAG: cyclic-di-AMP receptor [Thermomicrobiales bacterium]